MTHLPAQSKAQSEDKHPATPPCFKAPLTLRVLYSSASMRVLSLGLRVLGFEHCSPKPTERPCTSKRHSTEAFYGKHRWSQSRQERLCNSSWLGLGAEAPRRSHPGDRSSSLKTPNTKLLASSKPGTPRSANPHEEP